MNGKKWETCC
jgi:hypothetical protein